MIGFFGVGVAEDNFENAMENQIDDEDKKDIDGGVNDATKADFHAEEV